MATTACNGVCGSIRVCNSLFDDHYQLTIPKFLASLSKLIQCLKHSHAGLDKNLCFSDSIDIAKQITYLTHYVFLFQLYRYLGNSYMLPILLLYGIDKLLLPILAIWFKTSNLYIA